MTPSTPVHQPPLRVDRDTWVIRESPPEGAPLAVAAHSLVVRAQEPVVIDTGTAANRDRWLADVFSLVDPGDVRWVFLSHDDRDHLGNIEPLLATASRAVLVTSALTARRLAGTLDLPPERWRWVDDGDSFPTGDRTFVALTPPLYDAPGTRGLYDTRSGVYWAADCFAVPGVSRAADVDDCAQLDPDEWRDGLLAGAPLLSPWCQWVDSARWGAEVDRVESLGVEVIASAHAPLVTGPLVDVAFRTLRSLADVPPRPRRRSAIQPVRSVAHRRDR